VRYLVKAVLILVGIIHLLPLSGVLGANSLSALYGVTFTDPNALILMRHRAVLFGLLGSFFLVGAFVRPLQLSALILASASVASFLVLSFVVGDHNANVGRVVLADWVAMVLLLIGFGAYALTARQAKSRRKGD
jgi:hypothetical protein